MISIAKFVTSFRAVVLGLLIFLAYRYFEVATLFYRYLPLNENLKMVSSILIAFVAVFLLTLFASHLEKFKLSEDDNGNWIKWTLFIFTLIINVFFWEPWKTSGDQPILSTAFKCSIAFFFAVFDFAFNHLFVQLWKDNELSLDTELKVDLLKDEVADLEERLSNGREELKGIIIKSDPRYCPHCGRGFDTIHHRNGHLKSCKVNTATKVLEVDSG